MVERSCPECGYVADDVPTSQVGARLRSAAAAIAGLLREPPPESGDGAERRRPVPTTWSALEYAAHVRDVCGLYRERLRLMLEQDGPHYPNWDQDETALAERYDLLDPATVATELESSAADLADAFDAVEGDAWDRAGFRGDGAAFTVTSFSRYFLHDVVHHLHDVRRGYATIAREDRAGH